MIILGIDFNNLLKKTTICLSSYLGKSLPILFTDWWNESVISNLSSVQKQRLKQKNSHSLSSLDIAALLRVLDQNWYSISNKYNLSQDFRHFIKEMQTIRNKWAHSSSEEFPIDDVYRDLDTLQRFCQGIDAPAELINEIQSLKKSLLLYKPTVSKPAEDKPQVLTQPIKEKNSAFEPGDLVCLKSNPEIQGAVIQVFTGQPESRYTVFVQGEKKTFYESQLTSEQKHDEDIQLINCEEFHSFLTSQQIRFPGLSVLYSLNAARIDFIPYQFRPVLKFIRSDRPRLLIADSVGVGKTIEAGLILRELQARRDVNSVLIICPRPLVTEQKWRREMKRFDEEFTQLDGGTLRYCIKEMDLDGTWPVQHRKTIIPYSLFDETLLYGSRSNTKKGLLNLDPPPKFDLVIVDEAHHIRNQDTFKNNAVQFFCDHAEAVVFLTATPIQLGAHDLYVLLNTLRPDLIIDKTSFDFLTEPNPFINQAVSLARENKSDWEKGVLEALYGASNTPLGKAILGNNPILKEAISILKEGQIPPEKRIQLIKDIETLHTLSNIINRTRRRDIGDFTVRKPETITVEFTSEQKDLHDSLLKFQAKIFAILHGNKNISFMMTTIRRQASSCIFGLAPFIEAIINRQIDDLSLDEIDDISEQPAEETISFLRGHISNIVAKAKKLTPYDPKLNALCKVIKDKQVLKNNKVMLFSSFRHTLSYLFKNLLAQSFRVSMIHGNTPDEERLKLRERFEMDREDPLALDILLFSEVGCEGLDYQFCDCLVNYDLPWNPMRIEQRIGRIDRKGQKSESVLIKNFITPGTLDAEIYTRCLLRIGVFEQELGGNEEILGELSAEIQNIAENFNLTDEEKSDKLQQLADNKIRFIQEQEELEKRHIEFFGIQLTKNQLNKEIDDATSFWLSPASIQRMINTYLTKSCGKEQDFILGEKSIKTLRLSNEARNLILKDFQKLQKQNIPLFRQWENYLKGSDPHLPITFDSECAVNNPNVALIMPLHPLVKQAANSYIGNKSVITKLKTLSDDIKTGSYEFAIYQWHYHGIKEDMALIPVTSSEKVSKNLISLLESATDDISEQSPVNSTLHDNLDGMHYKMWNEAKEKHKQKTSELSEYRRGSLTTSHNARISLLKEQLAKNDNDKIKKMKTSQLETAEADYARRIKELDDAVKKADITAEPVAYGIIEVLKEE